MISFDFGPGIDVFTIGCFGSSGKKDLAVAKDRTCLLNKEPVTERNVSINEGEKKNKKKKWKQDVFICIQKNKIVFPRNSFLILQFCLSCFVVKMIREQRMGLTEF